MGGSFVAYHYDEVKFKITLGSCLRTIIQVQGEGLSSLLTPNSAQELHYSCWPKQLLRTTCRGSMARSGTKMHQRECSERDLPSESVNYFFRNIVDKRVEARKNLHSNTLFLDFFSECTLRTSQVHWQTLPAHPVRAWDVWMPVKEKVWFILVMSSNLI